MACLGLSELLRIAESGLAAVPGAAEHVARCDACAAALGAQVRAKRGEGGAEAEQMGRYQILGERGGGAFGRVFEAYDPALDRSPDRRSRTPRVRRGLARRARRDGRSGSR